MAVTAALTEWTEQDSADLTAELIVSGAHMNAAHLNELELAATFALAARLQVPRGVIEGRIGWKQGRIIKWCRDRGIATTDERRRRPA
jgi:hypothetical protein